MKQIFKANDCCFNDDEIVIYQFLTNDIEISSMENYSGDRARICLNKEQAIEMANAILKHYNS